MSTLLNQELKEHLYEYELLTSQQLSIITGLNQKTIRNVISASKKKVKEGKEIFRKVDTPMIGRGTKAYYLSPSAAKQAAEAKNEMHLYREKDWETVSGSIVNILVGNQFFCELIRASAEDPEVGVINWLGRRSTAEHYATISEEEKKSSTSNHAKMNGCCFFHFRKQRRLLNLDVFTGNETMATIQEKLVSHLRVMQGKYADGVCNQILLLVYLGSQTGKRLLKTWEAMTKNSVTQELPFFAVASFDALASNGILAKSWQTTDSLSEQGSNDSANDDTSQTARVSILDMPFVQTKKPPSPDEMMGKQKRVKLQFKEISGFSVLNNRQVKESFISHNQKESRSLNVLKADQSGYEQLGEKKSNNSSLSSAIEPTDINDTPIEEDDTTTDEFKLDFT